MPRQMVLTYIVGLLLVCGCDDATPPPQQLPPPALNLTAPVRVSVVQRTSEPIPDMGERLYLRIDDITAGQVLVKITTAEGDTVLPNTAIKEGQELTFRYQERDYTLRLIELENFLVGDDYAVFEVSQSDAPDDAAVGMTEQDKIERLIQMIEALQDATFIRNGQEHTPAEAAQHMRDKWKWKAGEINTAEDFIRLTASRSSMTGEPYLIRFADGREVTAGEYLQQALSRMP